MSKSWSKIYNNKNFFRNTDSFKVLNLSKKYNWNYQRLAFELFKIMNPQANNVSLKKSFRNYINFIIRNIKRKNRISILDYGSGNGFTLYYLYKKNFLNKIYSKDVNYHFIRLQKKLIKLFNYEILKPEKNFINEKTKSIDWVISNAVLHCLPNKKNVKNLILEMTRIAKKGVLISDVFNEDFKKEFISQQMKRQNLTKKEYLAKYKKTPHLYFKKSFFKFLKKNKLNYKILKMPKSFYDSQFGRFAVLIKF
jgi:SAM-dependent methyltransferase